LNTFWMLAIVFFPWPAAMYGSLTTDQFSECRGVSLFYWWTLATISGLGWLIARHAWSNPQLLESCVSNVNQKGRRNGSKRGFWFFTYFFVIGIVSEFVPQLAPYLSLGIIPLSILLKRDQKSISV